MLVLVLLLLLLLLLVLLLLLLLSRHPGRQVLLRHAAPHAPHWDAPLL